MSLDLSYNSIVKMENTIITLQHFGGLKLLHIQGNPITLNESYVSYLSQYLSQVSFIDGINVLKSNQTMNQTKSSYPVQ